MANLSRTLALLVTHLDNLMALYSDVIGTHATRGLRLGFRLVSLQSDDVI